MRTTFSCVLCVLLLAACCTETTSTKDKEQLLKQAIMYLNYLIKGEKDDISLHSPTNLIKECCSQSALECFRKEFTSIHPKNLVQKKLARNLLKPYLMNSVNTCSEEEIKTSECMSCSSYPVVSSKQFLINFQSHLQKAYSRLS